VERGVERPSQGALESPVKRVPQRLVERVPERPPQRGGEAPPQHPFENTHDSQLSVIQRVTQKELESEVASAHHET
jgi:hypothetical protein